MFRIIVNVLQIIITLFITVAVLFQSGKQQGLSGAISGSAETFFGKNKAKTTDAMLKKWTAIAACAFIVVTIVLQYTMMRDVPATGNQPDLPMNGSGNMDFGDGFDFGDIEMDEDGNLIIGDGDETGDDTANDDIGDGTADDTNDGEANDTADDEVQHEG